MRRSRRCSVDVVLLQSAGMAHAPLRSPSSPLSSARFLLLCLQSGHSPCCHGPGVVRSRFRGSRRGDRVQFALLAETGAFKEGAQRGPAWCLPENRDVQFKGPGNVVRRHVVAPTLLSQCFGGGYGGGSSDSRCPSSCDACPGCRVCTVTARGSQAEMLSANCDSRTWGNGQRNCQAANGASRKRATDRQQGTSWTVRESPGGERIHQSTDCLQHARATRTERATLFIIVRSTAGFMQTLCLARKACG